MNLVNNSCSKVVLRAIAVLFAGMFALILAAGEITPEKAGAAASRWARNTANLQNAAIGTTVKAARAYSDKGTNLFNIVQMEGGGFVITSADSAITPIIAFSESDDFEESDDNPLLALLLHDIPDRVHQVNIKREEDAAASAIGKAGSSGSGQTLLEKTGLEAEMAAAEEEWAALLDEDAVAKAGASAESEKAGGASRLSDTRVSPLVQSKWDQGEVGSKKVYNYYTSQIESGKPYICGCVATAISQIMRYHKYPTASLPRTGFACTLSENDKVVSTPTLYTKAGIFDWDNMPLIPTASINSRQQEAIGKLTYNVGVACQMNYGRDWVQSKNYTGWAYSSGTDTLVGADALTGYFGYASAVKYYDGSGIGSDIAQNAILANLDFSKPVCLGIRGAPGGHAIVADGYGFNRSEPYVHLNLGWSGDDDAWYSLSLINTSVGTFTKTYKVIYNIFPKETGEIISGRVLNSSGTPQASVTVKVLNSSGTQIKSVTTNSKGIYAVLVPSSSTYTVKAASGSLGGEKKVTVGRSGYTPGNRWGQDITVTSGGSNPSPNPNPSPDPTPTPTTYTVSFNSNGGNGTMRAQVFDKDVAKTLSENAFVRLGYEFAGWSTSSSGSATYRNRQSFLPTSDMTLYAVWTPNVYTLTLDANGGYVTASAYSMTYNATVNSTIAVPSRNGDWIFNGWWTQKEGGERVFDSTGRFVSGSYWTNAGKWFYAGNLTVYAQWEEDFSKRTYTVTFDPNGGSGYMPSQTFRHGRSTALAANAFSRKGWTFSGWAVSPSGAIKFTNEQSISLTGNIDLFAIWEENVPILTIENGILKSVNMNGTTYVNVPADVAEIGTGAFRDCTDLKSIKLPEGLDLIGDYAFCGCTNLLGVTIPHGVKSIGSHAFDDCHSLETLYIPDSALDLGDYLFFGAGIKEVRLPQGLYEIKNGMFCCCVNLKHVSIPTGVYSIGSSAFDRCRSLESVSIPEGVVWIHSYAFADCESLKAIWLPDSAVELKEYLFSRCKDLSAVRLPQGLKIVEYGMFSGCSNLSSIDIPSSVEGIERYAFFGCSMLTSIDIPASVAIIEDSAFSECQKLSSIEVEEGNSAYRVVGGMLCDFGVSNLLCCPPGVGVTDVTLPDTIQTISPLAFYGCDTLKRITLPDGMHILQSSLFAECTALEEVVMPSNLGIIGFNAFHGCSSLRKLDMPTNVWRVGARAFSGCAMLKGLIIPSGANLEKVLDDEGRELFAGCKEIRSLVLPETIKKIGDGMFRGCSFLVGVMLPESVKSIGCEAFVECPKMKCLVVPPGVTNIDCYAFTGFGAISGLHEEKWTKLKRLYVPGSLAGSHFDSVDIDLSVTDVRYYYSSHLGKVTYAANDGTGRSRQNWHVPGMPVFLDDNIYERDGYMFAGWSRNANGPVEFVDRAEATFSSDVVLYAQWKPIYTIAFSSNEDGYDNLNTQEAVEGSPQRLADNIFARTGFVFAGWATEPRGDVVYMEGSSIVAYSDMLLYAKWEKIKYKATFDANGGMGGTVKTQEYGSSLVAPAVSRAGYDFLGWSPVVPTEMPASDTTYTAQWKIITYTATLDLNGGSGQASVQVNYGTRVDSIPEPSWPGHLFVGWFTAAEGGERVSGDTVVSGDLSLYAHWVAPYTATKAAVLNGAVCDGDGNVVGVVQLKVGKPNVNKRNTKVSGSVMMLGGKKITLKTVTVEVPSDAPISVEGVAVKGVGTMSVEIGDDGFAGELGAYTVQSADVGGNWTTDGSVFVDFSTAGIVPDGTLEELLPYGEPVIAKGGKWSFAKAATVKWAKPKKGAEVSEYYDEASGKDLVIDTTKGKTNLSGIKLTYTPKTGEFKGSFKIYALTSLGKAKKLTKYTVNVTGIVVDGVGQGTATLKKPVNVSWPVLVE